MNTLLNQIFAETKYSRFGYVFEMPLKNIVNRQFIRQLPLELSEFASRSWSHVDFTIFNKVTKEILFGIEVDGYKYHKKGTKQAERDEKKNQIFKIIGLSLLRFSTKGSNEKARIKEELNKFLN